MIHLVLERRVLVGGVVDGVHEEDGCHVVVSQEQPQHGPGLHAAALGLHADEPDVPLKEVPAINTLFRPRLSGEIYGAKTKGMATGLCRKFCWQQQTLATTNAGSNKRWQQC